MADRPLVDALLPSRGRPGLLPRSAGSLHLTASRRTRVHVLVAADADDLATAGAAVAWGDGCVLFAERHGYPGLHCYYQGLARRSAAPWLLVWNDDAVMLTQNWDTILEALPPQVMVADLQSRHSPICCFPAVRREAVQAIGCFCSGNPHVDSFWEVVGRESGTIVPVPIWVRHDQQPHAHQGNEHGFHDPAHRAELSRYAAVLRRRIGAPA